MLSFNLSPIFKARRIEQPYAFLVKAGFSPTTAHKIINNETRIFRLAHIEKLCKLLICEPNDLLVWTPEDGNVFPENFPLSKLKSTGAGGTTHDTLQKMPYQQLKEVISGIANKGNV